MELKLVNSLLNMDKPHIHPTFLLVLKYTIKSSILLNFSTLQMFLKIQI